ncbi:hypothetical protein LXL04_004279 [Taraxacum kok-saghyz]
MVQVDIGDDISVITMASERVVPFFIVVTGKQSLLLGDLLSRAPPDFYALELICDVFVVVNAQGKNYKVRKMANNGVLPTEELLKKIHDLEQSHAHLNHNTSATSGADDATDDDGGVSGPSAVKLTETQYLNILQSMGTEWLKISMVTQLPKH